MEELKPCPFCGAKARSFIIQAHDVYDGGWIICQCGARMFAATKQERFEKIRDDLYRKIPSSSWRDEVAEAWNRRTE